MDTDICPKDKHGKHDYRPAIPFGSPPNAKSTSAHCRNCEKTIDYTEDEIAFPDLNSTTEDK